MRAPVVFGRDHRKERTIVASASAGSLLERDRELAQLAALVDAAAAGRGGVSFVHGPAGMGKTTLLEAARGHALARGMRVLAARAGALERAWAFGLVHGLLGRALDAGERAELLRGAAALAAPFVDPAAKPRGGADPEFATVHGRYWLCADLSARRPLLLVADDAHWADAPSLRFLVHLARRAGELPLALIVAARPPGPEDERELLAALAVESGLSLAPAALSAGAVAELARRRLGEHATAELVAACVAESAGNPFLLHAALGELGREPDPARLVSLAARGSRPRWTAGWRRSARARVSWRGRLADDELALARRWGAPTPIGRALRVLGLLEDDLGTLSEAVDVLARSPARVERRGHCATWAQRSRGAGGGGMRASRCRRRSSWPRARGPRRWPTAPGRSWWPAGPGRGGPGEAASTR